MNKYEWMMKRRTKAAMNSNGIPMYDAVEKQVPIPNDYKLDHFTMIFIPEKVILFPYHE